MLINEITDVRQLKEELSRTESDLRVLTERRKNIISRIKEIQKLGE